MRSSIMLIRKCKCTHVLTRFVCIPATTYAYAAIMQAAPVDVSGARTLLYPPPPALMPANAAAAAGTTAGK